MVEIKFIVELVVIILGLAVALYWFWHNYQSLSEQFFGFLSSVPSLLFW